MEKVYLELNDMNGKRKLMNDKTELIDIIKILASIFQNVIQILFILTLKTLNY